MRALAFLLVPCILAAQPKFEVADVHACPPSWIAAARTRISGNRFELRNATMLDLVRIAWNVDADKVIGGPVWLEKDRFDVLAEMPPNTPADTRRAMLRALLEERFALHSHTDTRDFPAYALAAGRKPLLEKAGTSDEAGCASSRPGDSVAFACRGMTMAAFVNALPGMRGASGYLFNYPVVEHTGLAGAWNFTLHWSPRLAGQAAPTGEIVTVFEALDKQLGLKLELTTIPEPVVVVDNANQAPTPNLPEVSAKFPAPPLQFEVADIRPVDPDEPTRGASVNIQTGGRVRIVMTLRELIAEAWGDFNSALIFGAPKSSEDARFVVTAKAPSPDLSPGPAVWNGVDIDSMRLMLRALIVDRFRLQSHTEERLVPGQALVAAKPKLRPADPSNRPGCKEGVSLDGKDPRLANPILSRLVTCRNMSMAELAAALPSIGPMPDYPPVLNATALEGRYDLTLSFSPWNAFPRTPTPVAPTEDGMPAAPNGAVSLADALQHQLGLKLESRKVPSTVLVIDHVNDTPTDN